MEINKILNLIQAGQASKASEIIKEADINTRLEFRRLAATIAEIEEINNKDLVELARQGAEMPGYKLVTTEASFAFSRKYKDIDIVGALEQAQVYSPNLATLKLHPYSTLKNIATPEQLAVLNQFIEAKAGLAYLREVKTKVKA